MPRRGDNRNGGYKAPGGRAHPADVHFPDAEGWKHAVVGQVQNEQVIETEENFDIRRVRGEVGHDYHGVENHVVHGRAKGGSPPPRHGYKGNSPPRYHHTDHSVPAPNQPKHNQKKNHGYRSNNGHRETIDCQEACRRYGGAFVPTEAHEVVKHAGTIDCAKAARKYRGVLVAR